MKRVTSALIAFFIPFLSVSASSCATDPYESIKPISDKIFASEKPPLSYVKEQAFPYIDVEYMAKYVVGRYHWNGASDNSKQRFLKEYQRALEKSYNQVLNNPDLQHIKVSLKKTTPDLDSGQVLLFATLNHPKKGKKIIGLYFHCVDEHWKIYDISYDNMHMLEQIKLQYATVVRHEGLKGLTKELKKIK